jgi:thiosulfate/3-mercaptopyruvate sulfurtransferase
VTAVLTTADELAARPADVLLDVRWQLGRTDGREQYRAGHLPGAVFVDLDAELSAPPTPAEGRHPLPSVQSLQAAARRWGISTGARVVVYDAVGGTAAARAWWLLRWAGLTDVTLLDGGLSAWPGPLETGDVVPAPGDVTLTGGAMPVLTIDEAAALPATGVLLDARAGERFRGEVEPVDPQAGHVPGAVSAPSAANLDDQGRFLPAAVLTERFAGLGVTGDRPVGVYCGSGVFAAHEVAALAQAGIEAALWPGSWSQWSNDPARPVATGP